jgi:hypothetical protein
MRADAWFSIGDTHLTCEDFALAGGDEDHAWALVCDGCSSSPHTDVGARLLAFSARARLRGGELPDGRCVSDAHALSEALGLPPQCLDATLVVARADVHGCRVRVHGDGVVLARRRDGALEIHIFEQPDGAPQYPSYRLSPERMASWRRASSGPLLHRRPDAPSESRTWSDPPELWFAIGDYDAVAVASDGLTAFRSEEDRALPVSPIAARLFAFKTTSGRFMSRRARRFRRRECAAFGWRPLDDMAIAAITLGEAGPR